VGSVSTEIGTPDPISLFAMADDGGWIAICQAREDTNRDGSLDADWSDPSRGDALRPFLVFGHGPGEPIDQFLAGGGPYVAVVRSGVPVVIDARSRAATQLVGFELAESDGLGRGPMRSLSLDRDHLVYRRADGVTTRDLRAGRERTTPLVGRVWSIEIDDGGHWAKVVTYGNGPHLTPKLGTHSFERCRPWHDRPASAPGNATVVWVELATGTKVIDAEVIRPVGRELLREHRGRLQLGTEVLATGCDWGVDAVVHDPSRVIAGCGFAAGSHTAPLRAYGAGLPPTALGVQFHAHNISLHGPPSYYKATPNTLGGRHRCEHTFCVDVVAGTRTDLPGGLLYQHGDRVLSMRGDRLDTENRLVVVNLTTGAVRWLGDDADRYEINRGRDHEGPLLVFGRWDRDPSFFDMRTARRIPVPTGFTVHGTDRVRGRFVVGRDPVGTAFARGPLEWLGIDG
jgi:hypothetical protein